MTQPKHMPEPWAEVLEQIRQALDAALAQTPPSEPELTSEQADSSAPPLLAQAETRIGRLRQLAERAREQQIEQAAALGEGEERLRRWLAEALATRQRLAEWGARSVG
jgi:hypothetical protein